MCYLGTPNYFMVLTYDSFPPPSVHSYHLKFK
uniref:Uncharacterized protein n=1 Tax=Arundo donax TaxID=35708 RepID=A0A0A9GFJ1_ARUDO